MKRFALLAKAHAVDVLIAPTKVVSKLVHYRYLHLMLQLSLCGADGLQRSLEQRYLVRQHQRVIHSITEGYAFVEPQQRITVITL